MVIKTVATAARVIGEALRSPGGYQINLKDELFPGVQFLQIK